MITEILDTFLADFGVPVVCGGVSGVGVLDMPDQLVGDISLSTEYSVLVKAADFHGVARNGAAISVNGVNYKVREFKRVDDGSFARVVLSKI